MKLQLAIIKILLSRNDILLFPLYFHGKPYDYKSKDFFYSEKYQASSVVFSVQDEVTKV